MQLQKLQLDSKWSATMQLQKLQLHGLFANLQCTNVANADCRLLFASSFSGLSLLLPVFLSAIFLRPRRPKLKKWRWSCRSNTAWFDAKRQSNASLQLWRVAVWKRGVGTLGAGDGMVELGKWDIGAVMPGKPTKKWGWHSQTKPREMVGFIKLNYLICRVTSHVTLINQMTYPSLKSNRESTWTKRSLEEDKNFLVFHRKTQLVRFSPKMAGPLWGKTPRIGRVSAMP